MAFKRRFTREQVEAAVRDNGGSVLRAAKALGCADVTIYTYLGRTGRHSTNGHAVHVKTAVDVLREELSVHEAEIARINGLLTERASHEEKAERLRMAIGILSPPAPLPEKQSVAVLTA